MRPSVRGGDIPRECGVDRWGLLLVLHSTHSAASPVAAKELHLLFTGVHLAPPELLHHGVGGAGDIFYIADTYPECIVL